MPKKYEVIADGFDELFKKAQKNLSRAGLHYFLSYCYGAMTVGIRLKNVALALKICEEQLSVMEKISYLAR